MANRRTSALRFPVLTRFYDRVMRLLFDEQSLQGRLVVRAGVVPAITVLYRGVVTGGVAQRAATEGGEHILGVDADLEALLVAVRKARSVALEVWFCVASADAIPLRESACDQVLSSLLLHHLRPREKRSAMAEIRRVLREDGELHLMDWGKATGPIMRLAFIPVQMLDGFANTAENVRGAVRQIISESGLTLSGPVERTRTALGVIEFHRAFK